MNEKKSYAVRLVIEIVILSTPKKSEFGRKRERKKKWLQRVSVSDQWAAGGGRNEWWRWTKECSCERVLTTNRLTLTLGVRGDSFVCEPRDSKRALRLLADSMLSCSPDEFWAISISAMCWLLVVVLPSVSSQCSNFAHKVFARAAFCACFKNSSSTWNTRSDNFHVVPFTANWATGVPNASCHWDSFDYVRVKCNNFATRRKARNFSQEINSQFSKFISEWNFRGDY